MYLVLNRYKIQQETKYTKLCPGFSVVPSAVGKSEAQDRARAGGVCCFRWAAEGGAFIQHKGLVSLAQAYCTL